MEPLPATAEALGVLGALGDEDLTTKMAWMCESVLEVVPQAHALAIWFCDEDLTLAFVTGHHEGVSTGARPAMTSSLALRLATPTRVTSVVTVYSGHLDAFVGRVDALEHVLGASVGASVLDDDVGFDARARAESAPAQVRAQLVADTAVGLLMENQGFTVDEAEAWLDRVSRTSGRGRRDVAAQVVAAHRSGTGAASPKDRRRGDLR